ncbi:MAG: threonine--tRNA ligase [Stygiobacter sp.]|nr:MAG: threonine--tRNA ligase [Stygiobacter sp. GWC2_38_9]OGV11362.1 MAG: threonine--tRNA ligase [Stygiobacter sp. RIFOXYA2_FULL_38_8]OGV16812.1 MAG: threonine--tRNA ligase [Stygiobacter sp. RIFOXYC2_FULL_38_25]OGV82837.1 MAG: threonine--tRNA ligase [Stygiobacter sp. GWF2_38_21]RJQ61708.1 MAG: threonine--tRNA ligase [Stygiobacter sp.]
MEKINIKFPDGSVREFDKGVTPYEVAKSISNRLADDALVAKVNGSMRDLSCKLESDSDLQLFTFDSNEGKETYWHSSSHLMAHAVLSLFPEAKFGVGPAIEGGFYYDIDINSQLTEEDLVKIENKMIEIAGQKNAFKRTELSKTDALKFFEKKGDQYKLEIISELDETATAISIYDEGDFTDLCTGPHISDAGRIKFVKLLTVSGSYWRGDEKKQRMQRIYGITFPKKKMLEDHLAFLEEAKKRDHRKLGKQLDLFSIHEEAGAGLIYWHPKGARVRNTIETFWRAAHLKNGYDILYSPHMGKSWLWQTSGHLSNYKDNMYAPMNIDEQEYFIKPMNCPFHILIYQSQLRSYRDLPLRWAELGTVYRYEKSGVLHGLLRVRGFTQDDAHIFCTQEQIEDEIIEVIRFSNYMWKSFGFESLKFYIATKPEKAVGDDAIWEKATNVLKLACEKESIPYEMDEGGGAFYGPKIDIKIKDALNREWQMSTIQFDFNLPERFGMTYIGEDGKEHRPYMVHRALLGSIERFFGVLIEHYGGAFPTWLAPLQVAIVPVSQVFMDYAKSVADQLKAADINVELDERNEKIGYKIRDWETKKVPYMLVVGEKEKEADAVSVRQHKLGDKGSVKVSEFIKQIKEEIDNKVNHN